MCKLVLCYEVKKKKKRILKPMVKKVQKYYWKNILESTKVSHCYCITVTDVLTTFYCVIYNKSKYFYHIFVNLNLHSNFRCQIKVVE